MAAASAAEMCSETAVRRRRAEATAIEETTNERFPQLNTGEVGLARPEPAASSLSEIDG
jgi:hypothetical protein